MGHKNYPGMIRIPLTGKSKPRPAVSNKRAYMPKEYMEWKVAVGQALKELKVPADEYEGAVALEVIFGRYDMWVQVVPVNDTKPKGLKRNDIDNLVGGVMDALENYGIYKNDAQVVSLDVMFEQEVDDG